MASINPIFRDMNNTTLHEHELTRLLKLQNEKAFRFLYNNYSAAVYNIINRLLQDAYTSNDVMQLVFVRIWKSVPAYDPRKSRLYTWIFAIARNAATDELRRRSRLHKKRNILWIDEMDQEISLPINSAYDNIDAIGIYEYISKLPAKYRVIIEMSYFGGYSSQQISSILHIPLGTVKTRKRDAMTELQESLAEPADE